jgi:phosphoribosylamine--glycine ligase
MRLDCDLVNLLEAVVEGRLAETEIRWDPRAAVCVVMASGGYPGEYEKGHVITGLDEAAELADVQVFHAGTSKKGDEVVTAGGRVLGVTALGDDIKGAVDRAYAAVEKITWKDAQFRRDIGAKALAREAMREAGGR